VAHPSLDHIDPARHSLLATCMLVGESNIHSFMTKIHIYNSSTLSSRPHFTLSAPLNRDIRPILLRRRSSRSLSACWMPRTAFDSIASVVTTNINVLVVTQRVRTFAPQVALPFAFSPEHTGAFGHLEAELVCSVAVLLVRRCKACVFRPLSE
jgi:hypothetical protein